MSTLEDMTRRIIEFRDARDWKQFHNPKDLAISLVLEATEVLEHFQWKDHIRANKADVADELADALYWIILMSNDLEIDVVDALDRKMKKNEAKYPVDKAKGKHTKYNKL
jgi:NTP pyrophosphatase (non-canonical NTP hydrolase)